MTADKPHKTPKAPPPTRRVRPRGGPTVVVVGRPNVGKSTLVNRLTGRRDAIVEAKPGVTRDRTAHGAQWRGRDFTLMDTGGWTPGWEGERDPIDAAVAAQAELATESADLVLFVVDLTVGITEEDAAVAEWLRASGVPVRLIANKADTLGQDGRTGVVQAALAELYGLGVGEPIPVSALHGRGSGDLLDVVVDGLADAFERGEAADEEVPGVALIGRPNVGKSSLFNRLIGTQRTIVDDRPGTTRDAVDTVIEFGNDRTYRFVDTAGLRRKSRHGDATEYYSTVRTVQALDAASVALLVIGSDEPVGEQEQKLARQVLDAGRGLILVLNKWDLLDEYRRDGLERELERLLNFVSFARIVRTSAASGRGLDKLAPAIDATLEQWSRRLQTAALNEWLADAVAATPPPMQAGRSVRLRYITQVAVGPPTFRVFTTGELSPGYVRYLERRLRESFGFEGTPVEIGVRVRPRWGQEGGPGEKGGKGTKTAKGSRRRKGGHR